MSLDSAQLDAFLAIARTQNFSAAAKSLGVTQSAVSQRIRKLEDDLEITLFIRNPQGISLTEMGARLYNFCQTRERFESDFLKQIKASHEAELAGAVRVAGYSSIMRSVVIPALAPLLQKHPKLQIEFAVREMVELPEMLQRAEVDFAVMDSHYERTGIHHESLGKEVYVVIESSKHKTPEGTYLDNSPLDPATEKFMAHQKKKIDYRRSYMGDVYGIIDGVTLGLGRAVMPKHLIRSRMPVRIVKGFEPLELDVTLHYHDLGFYPALHKAIVDTLKAQSKIHLGAN